MLSRAQGLGMKKKMETTSKGHIGFRVVGFGFRLLVSGVIVELLGFSLPASGLGKAAKKELGSLVEEKGALRRSSKEEVEQLRQQGCRVTMTPSKCIFSLKAPEGRRKCRMVA